MSRWKAQKSIKVRTQMHTCMLPPTDQKLAVARVNGEVEITDRFKL